MKHILNVLAYIGWLGTAYHAATIMWPVTPFWAIMGCMAPVYVAWKLFYDDYCREASR